MVVHLLLESKYLKIFLWMSGENVVIKYQKAGAKILVKGIIPCDDLLVVAQHQDEELWEAVQLFDDLAGEPLETQLKIVPFFSIKRILKDIHDDYEPLAKKIYEVIKKRFMVIDIRRPSDDPLSIRFRWDKPLKDS
ncbi:hypothetical protein Glove_734g11 [Diversispora epigaea]|uniref:Uncharacterized protein n=1 Tax=Diversispora epigaea TaxID=1348612 RepID=A0A397G0Z7_9GLOM|nr:hypothetical protein Glove_734g11 [Diversispora epigaea]